MTNEFGEIQSPMYEVQDQERPRNIPTRTDPWTDMELITIGNHRKVWYVTDKTGAILYVYLAGGDVLTYQHVLELQRQGVSVRLPARARLNMRTWGDGREDRCSAKTLTS